MHYDFAIACQDPVGSGDIGSHTRLLIGALSGAGKRCVIFTAAAESTAHFADNPLVDYVVVETPATTPYETLTGTGFRYAYALCTKLITFLETHSIQTIEFPDRYAEGYFFITHNLVYRRIPSVVVRLHLPAFVIDDDNELSPRSLDQARVYAAEQEALQHADHIVYGGPAVLERVLTYFTENDANALRLRSTEIAPITPDAPSVGSALQRDASVKKIGCLGPLEYRKGADQLLIQAIRYFQHNPESSLRFYLIGDDTPTADGLSFLAYLRQLVPAATQTRFVFECPLAAHAREQQLNALDAFVFPARFDHHPAAFNEILALGKPVFVSTYGDMRERSASYARVHDFDPLSRTDWERVFAELETPTTEPPSFAEHGLQSSRQEIVKRYSTLASAPVSTAAPVRMAVVIAHLNDPENLTKLLLSLRGSKQVGRLEIIVVDDGSPQETVTALSAAFPEVAFLKTPHTRSGPFLARKIGAEKAACDYVMFVDADDHIDFERYLHYAQTLAQTDQLDVVIPAMRHFGNETHVSLPFPKSRITVLFECYIYAGLVGKKACLLKAFKHTCRAASTAAHSEDWIFGMSLLFQGVKVASVLDCAYFYNRTRPNTRSLENSFMLWQSSASRSHYFDQLIGRAITDKTLPPSDVKLLRLVSLGADRAKKTEAIPAGRGNQAAWHTHAYRSLLSLIGDRRYAPKKPLNQGAASTPVFRSTRPSSDRPKLLFVTQVLPLAEGNGPARRAFSVITALGKTYDVSLLWITHPSQTKITPENLPEGCIDWRSLPPQAGNGTVLRWRRDLAERHPTLFTCLWRQPTTWTDHSRKRLGLATELVAGVRYDVIHAFRMVMAPYALAIHQAAGRGSVQLDTDDVESVTLTRLAEVHQKNAAPVAAAEAWTNARVNARLECSLFPRFNRVFVSSEFDTAQLIRKHANIRILPNTVPVPAALPMSRVRSGPFRFLFLGTLDYAPNTDAVLWFCREIFPAIRTSLDCELLVAGLHAPASLREFLQQQERVKYLGVVQHSTSAFAASDALVVPLRAGGGTRLKIIESFAQGIPVISTALGIEGIAAHPEEHFLLADTPERFAQQARRLADHPSLRIRLVENAFQLVTHHYSTEALSRLLTVDIT